MRIHRLGVSPDRAVSYLMIMCFLGSLFFGNKPESIWEARKAVVEPTSLQATVTEEVRPGKMQRLLL